MLFKLCHFIVIGHVSDKELRGWIITTRLIIPLLTCKTSPHCGKLFLKGNLSFPSLVSTDVCRTSLHFVPIWEFLFWSAFEAIKHSWSHMGFSISHAMHIDRNIILLQIHWVAFEVINCCDLGGFWSMNVTWDYNTFVKINHLSCCGSRRIQLICSYWHSNHILWIYNKIILAVLKMTEPMIFN